MRVIAGRFRGRRLAAPPGSGTRPILDRVKVALFDWLGSRLAHPGELPSINVLDLFCGGGTLGIEALSRGAAFCTFVEQDRAAVAVLRRNLADLGIGEQVRVLHGDAQRVRIPEPPAGSHELVFFDPPYKLTEATRPDEPAGRIVARLGGEVAVAPAALLVWRHASDHSLPSSLAGGWASLERRTWGTLAVTMFERITPGAAR